MMSLGKLEMEKFNGLNDFNLWRIKMKAWLVHQRLLDAILRQPLEAFVENENVKPRYMGFSQKEGIDYHGIFSPIVKYTSITIILSMVAHMELEQVDIKITFLHGELNETFYNSQPKGFRMRMFMRMFIFLNKLLYGLN